MNTVWYVVSSELVAELGFTIDMNGIITECMVKERLVSGVFRFSV